MRLLTYLLIDSLHFNSIVGIDKKGINLRVQCNSLCVCASRVPYFFLNVTFRIGVCEIYLGKKSAISL
jgi:hypothetical protein